RRFLSSFPTRRSSDLEFNHVEECVRRQALSRFDTGFTLRHNQRVVQSLRPAETDLDKERRIGSLCGQQFIDNAVVIDAEATGLRDRKSTRLNSSHVKI